MKLSKPELRGRLKSDRQKLSESDVTLFSQKIITDCIKLIHWADIQNLHVYVSIAKDNEIDTTQLLRYVWEKYPHVQTVVPRLNRQGGYDSVVATSETQWRTKGVRIPEPISGEILAADKKFDAIIVPMLGFDKRGHRLGHGMGWYDRFLATQTQASTVGLCYEAGCIADGLPSEPHDIALQQIVTEKEVYQILTD